MCEYIAFLLIRFLPPSCPDFVTVDLEKVAKGQMSSAAGADHGKKLQLHAWQAAWDGYAIAGAALEQTVHKFNIMELIFLQSLDQSRIVHSEES